MVPDEQSPAQLFAESVAIMKRLRAPGGCPWDREQTFASIRRYTLEETYEVLDAIERQHWDDLAEELGDLLLQVLFYSQIAADEGLFSIVDVLRHLNRKLVRRHPHVFGDEAAAAAGNTAIVGSATQSDQVLRNWESIKRAEQSAKRAPGHTPSLLDAVPQSFPVLLEATKLGKEAAKVGFDWPDVDGLLAKVEEECAELRTELTSGEGKGADAQRIAAAEGELGDLLFTVANLARHLGVDPELALKRTTAKFRRRFRHMEESLSAASAALQEQTPEQLEALWGAAKANESAL